MQGTIRKRTILYLVSFFIREAKREEHQSLVLEDKQQARELFDKRKAELMERAYKRDDRGDSYTWTENSKMNDSRTRCELRYLDDTSDFTGQVLYEEVEYLTKEDYDTRRD